VNAVSRSPSLVPFVRRARARRVRNAAIVAAAALLPGLFATASAQLFSDDEARRAILDVRGRMEVQSRKLESLDQRTAEIATRLEQTARGQLELQGQIDLLKEEIAKLRGRIEEQGHALTQTQQRQRELYTDVDTRLKPLEPMKIELDGKMVAVAPEEKQAYEAALTQFRAGEFAASIVSFQQFRTRWPESAYTPHVLYWIGSAQFALKDYKATIAAQQALLSRFPDHPRAPDAMLAVGVAQSDSGDKRAARATFETLLSKYKDSQAAQIAKERLAALPK